MKAIKIIRQNTLMPNGKKMSQQNLADILNVSRSTVAMWETDGSEPDWTTLLKIANAFNITIDELINADKSSNEKKMAQILKAYESNTPPIEHEKLARTAFDIVASLPKEMQEAAIEQLKALAALTKK